jgi:hypothetical protein
MKGQVNRSILLIFLIGGIILAALFVFSGQDNTLQTTIIVEPGDQTAEELYEKVIQEIRSGEIWREDAARRMIPNLGLPQKESEEKLEEALREGRLKTRAR